MDDIYEEMGMGIIAGICCVSLVFIVRAVVAPMGPLDELIQSFLMSLFGGASL